MPKTQNQLPSSVIVADHHAKAPSTAQGRRAPQYEQEPESDWALKEAEEMGMAMAMKVRLCSGGPHAPIPGDYFRGFENVILVLRKFQT